MTSKAPSDDPDEVTEADWCAHVTLAKVYLLERDQAFADIERLTGVNVRLNAMIAKLDKAGLALAGEVERMTADDLVDALRSTLDDAHATIHTRDAQIAGIRAVAALWAKKRDEPHRPIPWRSVYAQFVDQINDALEQP